MSADGNLISEMKIIGTDTLVRLDLGPTPPVFRIDDPVQTGVATIPVADNIFAQLVGAEAFAALPGVGAFNVQLLRGDGTLIIDLAWVPNASDPALSYWRLGNGTTAARVPVAKLSNAAQIMDIIRADAAAEGVI